MIVVESCDGRVGVSRRLVIHRKHGLKGRERAQLSRQSGVPVVVESNWGTRRERGSAGWGSNIGAERGGWRTVDPLLRRIALAAGGPVVTGLQFKIGVEALRWFEQQGYSARLIILIRRFLPGIYVVDPPTFARPGHGDPRIKSI